MRKRQFRSRASRDKCKTCGESDLSKLRNHSRLCISCFNAESREKDFSLKLEVIAAYGNECNCCGESEIGFLTIDHIGGGGNDHRKAIKRSCVYLDLKKRGFPKEGFRLLCMNCNWAIRFGRECPHQSKQREKQYSMSSASESPDSNYKPMAVDIATGHSESVGLDDSEHIDPDHPVYGSWMNETGITPCGHRILLEIPTPSDIKKAMDNGIAIPETALERHTQAAVVALVLQLGPGAYKGDGKFQGGPWCRPGDFVAMSPYNGTRIKSPKTGKDYRFVNDDTIDGRVEGPEFLERG